MLALHVFLCGSCAGSCALNCTLACLWQDWVQIPYHHLSHHNNVNMEVSGSDGALVRKLAFSGGCANG